MTQTTVIRPTGRMPRIGIAELVEHRDLFAMLVARDIKLRYKQTAVGAAWAVLQPLVLMAVFSVFFGRFAHVSSDGRPYPVFAYSALVPWTLFSQAMTQASESLVSSAQVITKVYFPRLLVPLAAASAVLLDAAIATALLILLLVAYGQPLRVQLLTLPLVMGFAYAVAVSIGLWLSSLNVRYRDVRYTLPLLVQVWLFATPVVYALSVVPPRWRDVVAVNPMVAVVDLSRWAVLGAPAGGAAMLAISAGVTVVLLLGGVAYFRATERGFADAV